MNFAKLRDANVISFCPGFLLFALHPPSLSQVWSSKNRPREAYEYESQPLTSLNHVYSARLRYREAPLQRLLKSTLMHARIIITAAHRPSVCIHMCAHTRDLITHIETDRLLSLISDPRPTRQTLTKFNVRNFIAIIFE